MNTFGFRPPWQKWAISAAGTSAALAVGLIIGWWVFRPQLARKAGSGPVPTVSAYITKLQPPVSIGVGPKVGALAPDFILKTLDGGKVTLSSLRGQPVLVNFWASWCPPCRLEMPDLVRAYEANKAEGFVLLGVNLTFQDSLPDVQAFVQEFHMTFPVLLDEDGYVTEDLYRLRGLPMSIFVNRDGIATTIHIGAMTGEQIDHFVAEVLK